MDILEIRLIYNVVQFVLLAVARYYLFRTELRIPLGWAITAAGILSAAASGAWYIFLQKIIPFQSYRFLCIVLVFGLSCLIIQARFAKHALSYIAIFTYSVVLDTLSLYVKVLFPNAGIPNLDTLVLFILLLATLRPMIRLVGWITEKLSATSNDRVWNYLCLCGFSVMLLCLATTASNEPTAVLLLSRIFLALAMVGMFASALWIRKSTETAAQTRVALDLANQQVALQQSYYDALVVNMEEIRHMRHDLRHHHAVLSSMIQNGNTQAASAYIQSWDTTEDSTPVSGNLVADSLLSYYYTRGKELGFTLEAEVSLPKLPAISDMDLCVLIGNLLENAIDAQTHLPQEQRYVRICAKGDAQSFTLAIDNRFDGKLQKQGQNLLSSKEAPGHGIGLSSVRSVCKKYGGVLQLDTQEDLFLAGVVIGL